VSVNFKSIIGLIATFLVFVGYIPYFRDIIKGKTKPHVYSWLVWILVTSIVFGLQISNSAGVAAYATLASGLMCLLVLILGGIYKAKAKITKSDQWCLVAAVLSLILWLVAKQPIASTILITTVNFLALLPTFRKTWEEPFTETLFLYCFNAFRYILIFAAIQNYTIVTSLYIVSCFLTTVSFVSIILWRRKQLVLATIK